MQVGNYVTRVRLDKKTQLTQSHRKHLNGKPDQKF